MKVPPPPTAAPVSIQGHSEAARILSEEAGIQDYVTIELFER